MVFSHTLFSKFLIIRVCSTPSSESLAGIGLVFWGVLAACYWTFELDLISPTNTWNAVKACQNIVSFCISHYLTDLLFRRPC